MKIALCSTFVPFIFGGARNIVEWLKMMLEKEGHHVEIVYLPEVDASQTLFQQMSAFRWIDLSAADRVICFRPQAHLISHPHKIIWFIHHIRVYYDLWGTEYCGYADTEEMRGFRRALFDVDTKALLEAKHVFTNSKVVSERLKLFNKIDSEVLYPPVLDADRFYCKEYNDEIVYVSRLEHHKRQHLLVEAMAYTETPVKIRLCGASSNPSYFNSLVDLVQQHQLAGRVIFENRWISEEEKVNIIAHCLATAYLPLDEDSYGYPSIEASHASKAIITTTDAGGVLELVNHGYNGYICDPTPESLAKAMDSLYNNRQHARVMGGHANKRLDELHISWKHVIKRVLA